MGTFGINKTLNKEESAREVLDTILDISYDGIVVVDTNGYITMLSKAYAEFLEVDRDKIIGKHVTDVIENTRKIGRAHV